MDRNQYSFDNKIQKGEGAASLRLRNLGVDTAKRRWHAEEHRDALSVSCSSPC